MPGVELKGGMPFAAGDLGYTYIALPTQSCEVKIRRVYHETVNEDWLNYLEYTFWNGSPASVWQNDITTSEPISDILDI